MSTPAPDQVEILSPDLVPFISEANTSMVLAAIMATRLATRLDVDLEVEIGRITFQVVEVFHSDTLANGNIIDVPARQVVDRAARARNNFDQWNNLSLATGELLILACQPADASQIWRGLAAKAVESPSSPVVAALRQCYVIEKFRGAPEAKRTLLEDALTSSQDLLRYYALDSIGRGTTVERAQAVQMIYNAVASNKTAPANKVELGSYLTRQFFFDKDRRADQANQRVITSLTAGLVADRDAQRRLSWARYLASCVLIEFAPDPELDRTIRLSLIKASRTPAATLVIGALSDLTRYGAEDEREIITRLLAAWREAAPSNP
jgi:hypothetical protein